MARIMFDSTTPVALPTNVGMVAGYINGRYAWKPADWRRFPGAKQVRINVTGEPARGNMLDVENGDASPADAPRWYDSVEFCPQSELGIYCNRGNLPAVMAAMARRDWRLWLATLDTSVPTLYYGRRVDAVQAVGARALGFNADLSFVFNDGWHAA